MDIIKHITYAKIYSSISNGLYTTYTILSFIPLLLVRRKGVSPEDINNTINKLKNIQTNIKNRISHIDTSVDCFSQKSTLYYNSGNKRSAIYNLKLKKMYEREKEKLDSINFNIETQIFSIESMDLIIVTAETLKDTSIHMKSMNTSIDIDKIESTMEELQDHRSISDELQNIFSESISLDFNDEELLEELEKMNQAVENQTVENQAVENQAAENQAVENQSVENQTVENQAAEFKLLELQQNLPEPPIIIKDNTKPGNKPSPDIKILQSI